MFLPLQHAIFQHFTFINIFRTLQEEFFLYLDIFINFIDHLYCCKTAATLNVKCTNAHLTRTSRSHPVPSSSAGSRGEESSEEDPPIDITTVQDMLSSHHYKSFKISMIHKLRFTTDVQLGTVSRSLCFTLMKYLAPLLPKQTNIQIQYKSLKEFKISFSHTLMYSKYYYYYYYYYIAVFPTGFCGTCGGRWRHILICIFMTSLRQVCIQTNFGT